MRTTLLSILLFTNATLLAQDKKALRFLSFGIDYRQYPIDVENASAGPGSPIASPTYGELTDLRFWQTFSVHARFGIETINKWSFSVVGYSRYNGNHHTRQPWSPGGGTVAVFDPSTPVVKRIKFDLFLDAAKKIRLRKNQEKYLVVIAGVGLTNINTGTDLKYRSNFTGDTIRYKGSYLHFGPKLSIGYQYKKIRATIDAYVVEDEDKSDLTSLWTGLTLSYDVFLKKKNK